MFSFAEIELYFWFIMCSVDPETASDFTAFYSCADDGRSVKMNHWTPVM